MYIFKCKEYKIFSISQDANNSVTELKFLSQRHHIEQKGILTERPEAVYTDYWNLECDISNNCLPRRNSKP